MASLDQEVNANMLQVLDDNNDCFDFSFLFEDDHSLPENNNMTSADPPITSMPFMDVIPAAYHQDIAVSSNNKRKRDEELEDSPRKCFKTLETLESPTFHHQETLEIPSLHQETLENPNWSSYTVQPYMVNNSSLDDVVSGYIVGSFGPTTMGGEELEISPPKCFKALETLENPTLHQETLETPNLHQETVENPNWSSYTVQPYMVNNGSLGDVVSGYTVGSFAPTIMGGEEGEPIMKPVFGGSRRKTPMPWTVEEHVRFLIGIAKGHRGDWKTISRDYVRTRTAAQVTSHAQKHFLHQQKRNSANPSMRTRSSSSLYNIVSLADVAVSKVADALRYLRCSHPITDQ